MFIPHAWPHALLEGKVYCQHKVENSMAPHFLSVETLMIRFMRVPKTDVESVTTYYYLSPTIIMAISAGTLHSIVSELSDLQKPKVKQKN